MLFRLKENKEVRVRLIASLLHKTAPLRPMRVTCKCFCYECDLGILMRVIDDSMPGGCHFNERWLAEDKYKPWLRRGSSPRVASCKVCKNNDARVCADEQLQGTIISEERTYVMCVTVVILWCSEDEALTIVIQPSLTAFHEVTKYNLLIRHRAILKAMYFYW